MVRLDNALCDHSDIIISGGVDRYNNLLNWTMGLAFQKETGNLLAQMSLSNPEMILPEGRMMHASCIVQNAAGEPRLLVIGGKTGNYLNDATYSSSVIGFDLKTVYEPWLQDKSGEKWAQLSSMQSARANFAFAVVDNLVYVFGGVSGTGDGPDKAHIPQLVSNLCERYDPKLDKWETIQI